MNSHQIAEEIKTLNKDYYSSKSNEVVLQDYKLLAYAAMIERLDGTYHQGWTWQDYARVRDAQNDRLAAMEAVLLERCVEFERAERF